MMTAASVELIIPGLFKLPLDELDRDFLEQELSALNIFLGHAKQLKNTAYELDAMLTEGLGLAERQNLALAQGFVEKSSHNEGEYLLCQAIHLKPDMRNAIVLPLDTGQQTANDINIIIKDLNDYFNVDCYIKTISNQLYLMRLKRCDAPDIYPHHLSILGKKANQYMEQSRAMLPWYQLINEIQMFMHTHEINQKRLENGLLPINSLWCWGGGQLPQVENLEVNWYTNDEILRRFADRMGIFNGEIAVLSELDFQHHSVCIELSILETLKSVQNNSLKRILSDIERQLFQVLIPQVKSRRCSLKLRTGDDYDLTLSAVSFLKFWQQPKSLLQFQNE